MGSYEMHEPRVSATPTFRFVRRCGDATVGVSTRHPRLTHFGSGSIPRRLRPPTLFGKRIG